MKLIYTLVLLLVSSVLFGQTTGPTQPEVQGFMPINSNDRVDLYSGDLNKNIPLMTIPGPEGMSYPINIFYNSNLSMEMMPSMVGLGWNLNTGAIVRNLRGLPDDFKGDLVKQTTYTKPSWTISLDLTDYLFKKEAAGLDFQKGISAKPSLSMYYNNYSGIGADFGLNIQAVFTDNEKNQGNQKSGLIGNLGLNFDNQEGFNLSPSLSYNTINKSIFDTYNEGIKKTTRIGATFNSKQGFKDITLGYYRKAKEFDGTTYGDHHTKTTFSSSSPLPRIKQKRFSTSANFGLTIDGKKLDLVRDDKKLSISGSFMRSWVDGDAQEGEAYGAMHMEDWQDKKYNKNIITDFYRENDGQMHKKKMLTPIPVISYDMFTVQGHGVGGTFRVHQGSIGRLSDAELKTRTTSATISPEIGFGGAYKLGGDYGGSYGESYSGPWKKPNKYLGHHQFSFEGKSTTDPLFEPAYFKMIGEPSFMPKSEWDLYRQDTPIAFDIQAIWTKTKAYSQFNRQNGTYFNKRKNDNRIKRVNHIEYYTKKEIQNLFGTQPIHIEDVNGIEKPVDYSQGKDHHIHGYTVRKSNGVQYNYLLPAYNSNTVRKTFTIPSGSLSFLGNPLTKEKAKVIDKVSTDLVSTFAKVNNGAGDEFFSEEVIPEYAHTYFLTSILSPDYVDIDDNGPSKNDLGTYVKFKYYEVKDYKWRFPFKGYYYARGYMDNDKDDKASEQYGTKKLYYVKSIETKTHIAIFEYDIMLLKDANRQLKNKKLERIKLYSKATGGQNSIPIQTVHFKQDYELKEETINSTAANKGVLTLKELAFTYQDNNKGELTPYKFEYGNNIDYSVHQQDIWGAYQPDNLDLNLYNTENPFTFQYDYNTRNDDAAAWLLNKITLPNKGEIHIDYEKDDYAYVQDKKAMSYLTIIGTGESSNNINKPGNLKNDFAYVFFKSPVKLNTKTDVALFVNEMEHMKFRIYTKLKKKDLSFDYASDYVEGYAKIKSYGKYDDYTGFIEVELEKRKRNNYHPFRLAAYQYIRKSRPDLGPDYTDASNLHPLAFATRYLPDMLSEFGSLFDYYRTATVKKYAPSLDGDKLSFIRLNMPYKKYGDGARVKEVTLVSNDVNEARANTNIYGQEYKYLLADGKTSSGVAEFEPLVGISENPFTQPIFYGKKNKIIFADGGYLPEEPRGAGLFPSAKVGYSRVSVRNKKYFDDELTPTDSVFLSQSGINISEFYTAKDFPTRTDRKGALYAPMKIPSVPIPFIGSITYQHSGYSMGYQFEKFEGIYGSLKSVATYPYAIEEPTAPPIQKSVYTYKTPSNDKKALDDWVTVLHKEGMRENLYLNKNIDFYIDEIEASSFHTSVGIQPNLSYMPPVQFLPSLFPSFSYLNKSTRYLTSNKIIYTYPVLDKVEQFKDGAKVTTSNLFYDGETGEPIITSVTNEWDSLIYAYNFPAHWTYKPMKGAYKNYKAIVKIDNAIVVGKFRLINGLVGNQIPVDLLQEGDILRNESNQDFYVSALDRIANTFNLKARDNSPPTISSPTPSNNMFTIIKSGYKNLQSLKKGHIVSLKDQSNHSELPYIGPFQSLINAYNAAQPSFSSNSMLVNINTIPYVFTDTDQNAHIHYEKSLSLDTIETTTCVEQTFSLSVSQAKRTDSNGTLVSSTVHTPFIYFQSLDGGSCTGYLDLSQVPSNLITSIDFSNFRFTDDFLTNNEVYMRYEHYGHTYNNQLFLFTFYENEKCFSCEEKREPIPVLQASAIEFKDDWNINYKHLENETTDLSGKTLTQIKNNGSGNPWAFGIKGIWRPWRTSSYLEKRKQTQPALYGEKLRLDKDGEFNFYWFNWDMPIVYNEDYNWRWVNEVTQYNPNGLSHEGKNRLEIFSASLFGYSNHLVTASASNSKTTDIAFDGFEDYAPSEPINHGNFSFPINSSQIISDVSHSGMNALSIQSETTFTTVSNNYFMPETGKKYVISAWVFMGTNIDQNLSFNGGEIEVWEGGTILTSLKPDLSNFQEIDGWLKIEGVFTPTSSNIQIRLKPRIITSPIAGGITGIFDDIRIQPFQSSMETYVYDPENYRLKATLNNQNFATFYVYDEEGNPVSTKVETEEGIKTISTNRNNIHQN